MFLKIRASTVLFGWATCQKREKFEHEKAKKVHILYKILAISRMPKPFETTRTMQNTDHSLLPYVNTCYYTSVDNSQQTKVADEAHLHRRLGFMMFCMHACAFIYSTVLKHSTLGTLSDYLSQSFDSGWPPTHAHKYSYCTSTNALCRC